MTSFFLKVRKIIEQILHKTLVQSFLQPFAICGKHKVELFLYCLFIIFAGQLGTIINVIRRTCFENIDFVSALSPEMNSGNLYIFSLAIISSLMSPLFISFKNKNRDFFRIGIIFASILIFFLVFCAVFYSFTTQNNLSFNEGTIINLTKSSFDLKQFVFYIISIIMSLYFFGYDRLPLHEETKPLRDSYLENEKINTLDMKEKSDYVNDDGKGVTL